MSPGSELEYTGMLLPGRIARLKAGRGSRNAENDRDLVRWSGHKSSNRSSEKKTVQRKTKLLSRRKRKCLQATSDPG